MGRCVFGSARCQRGCAASHYLSAGYWCRLLQFGAAFGRTSLGRDFDDSRGLRHIRRPPFYEAAPLPLTFGGRVRRTSAAAAALGSHTGPSQRKGDLDSSQGLTGGSGLLTGAHMGGSGLLPRAHTGLWTPHKGSRGEFWAPHRGSHGGIWTPHRGSHGGIWTPQKGLTRGLWTPHRG
jgi:hypothetical protein